MGVRPGLRLGLTGALAVGLTVVSAAQTPVPPPRPFPGATAPPPSTKPADPAAPGTSKSPPPPPAAQGPAAAYAYPSAEFLSVYDAGREQKFYLYGTNASYAEIVLYYKNTMKLGSGRELMRTPAMQQFDLGRFDEESMAYPPSVVVKDYTWNNSAGYLFVSGTTEKRFKTIIQIVPPRN